VSGVEEINLSLKFAVISHRQAQLGGRKDPKSIGNRSLGIYQSRPDNSTRNPSARRNPWLSASVWKNRAPSPPLIYSLV
jgi:hypothetical protein